MNNKFSEARYDERQTAVRGRAFKWAYGTLLVALLLYAVTDGLWNWCVPLTGCAIAITASLYPFLWVCVFGEAYWWTDVSRTGQYVTMALLGLMNLGLGLADAARGDLVVDGELQIGGANLALGSAFIYLFVIAMVQRRRLSRDGEDE